MTTEKIVYDIREAIRQHSDDSIYEDRYLIYLVGLKRVKYLRQDLNNYQNTVDNSVLQRFRMELEEVSANECGQSELDCTTIMRTKLKLPKPIELHLKSAITSVKPTNKITQPFNFVRKERAVNSKCI